MSGAFILPVKSGYLGLDEMADPHFSHDGNRNCLDDLFDHLGVTLERGSAKRAYILAPA
jgi:hypothetical protein